jgi:hypothetical protein
VYTVRDIDMAISADKHGAAEDTDRVQLGIFGFPSTQ